MSPAQRKLSIGEASGQLRSVGLRCTPARLRILRFLADSHQPQSHADVTEALEDEGFDKSTVFRCLVQLHEASLLTAIDLGDRSRRYEWRVPGKSLESAHAHFLCVDCGAVTCIEGFDLPTANSKNRGRLPGNVTEALFKGHCNGCQ